MAIEALSCTRSLSAPRTDFGHVLAAGFNRSFIVHQVPISTSHRLWPCPGCWVQSKLYRAPGPYRTTASDCEHVPAAAQEPILMLDVHHIMRYSTLGAFEDLFQKNDRQLLPSARPIPNASTNALKSVRFPDCERRPFTFGVTNASQVYFAKRATPQTISVSNHGLESSPWTLRVALKEFMATTQVYFARLQQATQHLSQIQLEPRQGQGSPWTSGVALKRFMATTQVELSLPRKPLPISMARAETKRKQSMDIRGGLEAIRGYYSSGAPHLHIGNRPSTNCKW
ncbi:hypothetical protein N7519_007270 [Penicillium mononematosum]|uniref:uncharacterized protein n=1 Tax=Penicillium mononematosum TaxID=268346 RepID=UPI0025474B40|nr:uncharacterized protein N7519_007270 [Penicillium mononematosum]KAJ6185969.1 hypothetical protein N7519_007270 [Penicillium mononematosum]